MVILSGCYEPGELMSTSTIYTVGTALRRAQDNGLPVTVLVEGHWLDGQVAGLDGDGLVLVSGPTSRPWSG